MRCSRQREPILHSRQTAFQLDDASHLTAFPLSTARTRASRKHTVGADKARTSQHASLGCHHTHSLAVCRSHVTARVLRHTTTQASPRRTHSDDTEDMQQDAHRRHATSKTEDRQKRSTRQDKRQARLTRKLVVLTILLKILFFKAYLVYRITSACDPCIQSGGASNVDRSSFDRPKSFF